MWRTSGAHACSVCLIVLLCACAIVSANARATRHRPRHRNRRPHEQQEGQQYYWMCPDVVCRPLAPGCEHSEYVVLEYDYTGQDGRVVSVRCESCEFCLDMPPAASDTPADPQSTSRRRSRRSLLDNWAAMTSEGEERRRSLDDWTDVTSRRRARRDLFEALHHFPRECPPLQCPQVPSDCTDARLTDVLYDQRRCKRRCPACYDVTLV